MHDYPVMDGYHLKPNKQAPIEASTSFEALQLSSEQETKDDGKSYHQ